MEKRKKILFKLERDKSGYPPFEVESVWAIPMAKNNIFEIDNIPFYVYGINFQDQVEVKELNSELYFEKLIKPSGNSTIRIYCSDATLRQILKKELAKIGCTCEESNISNLFSVNIPSATGLKIALQKLKEMKEEGGKFEFENASS